MTQLGRYTLHELLGKGGFGEVYKATDAIGRTVAIKVLKPGWNDDSDTIARFRREVQTAGELFHSRIATILDFGEAEGRRFLVMRYVDGQSLAQLIAMQGYLDWETALRIAREAAEALDYAHGRGFIHRDIKPANFIISPTDGAVLTDFGLVKAAQNSGLSVSGVLLGTPNYIAPEVWNGGQVSPATDIYSLACVFYEMIVGKPLFEGENAPQVMTRHVLHGPQFPDQWPQSVPNGMVDVMKKALAEDPVQRYTSAEEFVNALQAAAKILPIRPSVNKEKQVNLPETPPVSPANKKKQADSHSTTITNQPTGGEKLNKRVPVWFWWVGGTVLLLFLGIVAVIVFIQSGLLAAKPQTATQSTAVALVATASYTPALTDRNQPSATSTTTATFTPIPTETRPPTPSATSWPTTMVDTKGILMALIPAGTFQMGSESGGDREKPVHSVNLKAFYMDVYEVTNARYQGCVKAKVCVAPSGIQSSTRSDYYNDAQFADYPVIYVSWNDARTYCEWRGARLPTEAEWEKAARGKLEGRSYSWGNEIDCIKANYLGKEGGCVGDTNTVGSYIPNGYGLYDMTGNVWEWVSSLYRPYPYISNDGREDLAATGDRVLRGGSWGNYGNDVRVSNRDGNIPSLQYSGLGFRCAFSPRWETTK